MIGVSIGPVNAALLQPCVSSAPTKRETLYPASARTNQYWDTVGTPRSVNTQTELETHNNSDASFDRLGVQGNGLDSPSGAVGVTWVMGELTYSGPIDRLVFYIRARHATGGAGETSDVAPVATADGANVAAAQGTTTSPAWYTFTLATKPGGGAWTQTYINTTLGKVFGWKSTVSGQDEMPTTYVDAYEYEFYIEVWG